MTDDDLRKMATPRTDAPCNVYLMNHAGSEIEREFVSADFARQLERELSALQKVRDEEKAENNEWRAAIESQCYGPIPSPAAARQAIKELVSKLDDWKTAGLSIAGELLSAGCKSNGIVDGTKELTTELASLRARVTELEEGIAELNSYDAPAEVQQLREKVKVARKAIGASVKMIRLATYDASVNTRVFVEIGDFLNTISAALAQPEEKG